MESFRWPRIVGEALRDKRGKGSWVDYVRTLRSIYGSEEEWAKDGLEERQWKRLVGKTVKEVAGREWMEEIEGRVDLGSYREKQQQLSRAEYLKGFRKGDDV